MTNFRQKICDICIHPVQYYGQSDGREVNEILKKAFLLNETFTASGTKTVKQAIES